MLHTGLDMIDQNNQGFNDDMFGNDLDTDNHSVSKSKLNANMNKDKKKNFFKKVCKIFLVNYN